MHAETFLTESSNCVFCSGVKPVVPITMLLPLAPQIFALASVAAGMLKSISTSNRSTTCCRSPLTITPFLPRPASSPASAPTSELSGRSSATVSSQPSAFAIASIRVLPIRPAAPVTAIRSVITVPLMRCDGSLFVAALRCSWQGRASRCLSGCAFIFGRCIEAGNRTLAQQPLRRVTGPTSIGRHAPSPCGIQVCKSANELVSELAPTSPLNRAGLAGPDSLTKPEALRGSRACFTALAKKLSEQFLTLRSGGPKDGRHGWQATNTNAQPGKPCPGQPGTSQPGSGRIAKEVLHTFKPRTLARRVLVGTAIKGLL